MGRGHTVKTIRRIELLQSMPIFGAIRADTLAFLLARAPTRFCRRGACFFHQGDSSADTMYVLEQGRVTVRKSLDQREMVLVELGQGDCFGEMALLSLSTRSASVQAETDCVAIELSLADLFELFERDAEQFALIQMNIGREVARRLLITDELLLRATLGGTTTGTCSALQPTVMDHHARQHGDDEVQRRADSRAHRHQGRARAKTAQTPPCAEQHTAQNQADVDGAVGGQLDMLSRP